MWGLWGGGSMGSVGSVGAMGVGWGGQGLCGFVEWGRLWGTWGLWDLWGQGSGGSVGSVGCVGGAGGSFPHRRPTLPHTARLPPPNGIPKGDVGPRSACVGGGGQQRPMGSGGVGSECRAVWGRGGAVLYGIGGQFFMGHSAVGPGKQEAQQRDGEVMLWGVGRSVGCSVGCSIGCSVGCFIGCSIGRSVGQSCSLAVHLWVQCSPSGTGAAPQQPHSCTHGCPTPHPKPTPTAPQQSAPSSTATP